MKIMRLPPASRALGAPLHGFAAAVSRQAGIARCRSFSIVIDELERRNLPGEFAMLPYVESGYEPIAARGDRPAGMWQLDPDTAREEGLVVNADYDGRLDVAASTTAALALIERYEKEFGDWRLADMAFNSGEYRVKNLLRGRDAHALSAAELGKLAFNPITHDHLDRLLALSCVIADPQRFGVTLPELAPGERLKTVVLQSGMDVRLAARLAGLDPADMKRLNAAFRRNRMVAGACRTRCDAGRPASNVSRLQRKRSRSRSGTTGASSERRARAALASWAAEIGIPVAVLAAANAIGESATVGPTTRLLLPGHEVEIAEATTQRADVRGEIRRYAGRASRRSSGCRSRRSSASIRRSRPSACARAIACTSAATTRTELTRLG